MKKEGNPFRRSLLQNPEREDMRGEMQCMPGQEYGRVGVWKPSRVGSLCHVSQTHFKLLPQWAWHRVNFLDYLELPRNFGDSQAFLKSSGCRKGGRQKSGLDHFWFHFGPLCGHFSDASVIVLVAFLPNSFCRTPACGSVKNLSTGRGKISFKSIFASNDVLTLQRYTPWQHHREEAVYFERDEQHHSEHDHWAKAPHYDTMQIEVLFKDGVLSPCSRLVEGNRNQNVGLNRRENRCSLAIFDRTESAHLGASENRDFVGSSENHRRNHRESRDFGALSSDLLEGLQGVIKKQKT